MATEPPASMDCLPTKALSHVATYLPKTERALFAVALTAPSASWERCGWQGDVAFSKASEIVMAGPYYGPDMSKIYEERHVHAELYYGFCLQYGATGKRQEKWDVLNFIDVEERVRVQLTDGDVGGVLACTRASNNLRILRLPHCFNVRGDGLAPLCGSAVLEKMDLSLASIKHESHVGSVPKISWDKVAPILESIAGREGNSLKHLNLPNKWCDENERVVHFVRDQFGPVSLESLREHYIGCQDCKAVDDNDDDDEFEITREGCDNLQSCEGCDMKYCGYHGTFARCDGCDKRKYDSCCFVWPCNSCHRNFCNACAELLHCNNECEGCQDKANCRKCALSGFGDTKECAKCGKISCSDCQKMDYCFSSEGNVCFDCHREDHDPMECHWRTMPPGLRNLVAERATEAITEDRVIEFWHHCTNYYLCSDKEYDAVMVWKHDQQFRSALMLATDFLLGDQHIQAVYLMFYVSLLGEVWIHGPDSMASAFDIDPAIEWLRHHFYTFRLVILYSATRHGLIEFLRCWEGRMIINVEKELFLGMLSEAAKEQSTIWLHQSLLFPPEEEFTAQFKLRVSNLDTGETHLVQATENTTLSWLLKFHSVSADGYTGRIRPTKCAAPSFLRAVHKGTTFFLSSSGKRTLGELGIGDGGEIVVGGVEPKEESPRAKAKPKNSKKAKKKGKGRAKQKKRSKNPLAPILTDEQLMNQYKEQHSECMSPVFEELGPALKDIRNQLNALTIHKLPPKVRKPKAKKKSDTESTPSCLPADGGGKAGKVAYPILVGEASNLYKTHKQLSRAPVIIDLHGKTTEEALQLLDTSLPFGVDTAMKGECPWVIPVDVICGGGSQILSEAVQGWIRRQRQVANRPKGSM